MGLGRRLSFSSRTPIRARDASEKERPMNSLTFVSALAAASSAGAAVAGVWHASRTFHRSAELKAFLAFTDRYEAIMSALPERLTSDWSDADDPGFRVRLRYFNLCSEELYLKNRKLLSKKVWS